MIRVPQIRKQEIECQLGLLLGVLGTECHGLESLFLLVLALLATRSCTGVLLLSFIHSANIYWLSAACQVT